MIDDEKIASLLKLFISTESEAIISPLIKTMGQFPMRLRGQLGLTILAKALQQYMVCLTICGVPLQEILSLQEELFSTTVKAFEEAAEAGQLPVNLLKDIM